MCDSRKDERDEAILDAAAVQKRDREDSGERLTADELVRSQGFDPADFGLPLTTGEGNTARQFHIRREHLLEGSALDVDPPFASLDVVLWRDYEAERDALREQLDAARQALATYEQAVQEALEIAPRHWQRYRDTFELSGEIRAARVVGRAALGVVGGRPETDSVSAASGARDEDR